MSESKILKPHQVPRGKEKDQIAEKVVPNLGPIEKALAKGIDQASTDHPPFKLVSRENFLAAAIGTIQEISYHVYFPLIHLSVWPKQKQNI